MNTIVNKHMNRCLTINANINMNANMIVQI